MTKSEITTEADRIRRRQFLKNWWIPAWIIDPRRRCPHENQFGIYGDAIFYSGGRRARCMDCGRLLPDLPLDERRYV